MSLRKLPLRLSLLPTINAYASRSFLARYSSKILVTRPNNETDTTTTDDEIADVDDTSLMEGLPADDTITLRSPPYSVASSVARRPWVATQDDTAVKFRMDMPGLSRDNVRVYLDNRKLVIRGKYPQPDEAQQDDVLAEDNFGTYDAEILLPENVKSDQIKSEMKHGVLFVTAPKEVTSIAVE